MGRVANLVGEGQKRKQDFRAIGSRVLSQYTDNLVRRQAGGLGSPPKIPLSHAESQYHVPETVP